MPACTIGQPRPWPSCAPLRECGSHNGDSVGQLQVLYITFAVCHTNAHDATVTRYL